MRHDSDREVRFQREVMLKRVCQGSLENDCDTIRPTATDNGTGLRLKKSMIITGGVNVYPAKAEKVLSAKPLVNAAAVFGVPSEDWGEEVVAVIVCEDALDDSGLALTLKDELGRYKAPKRIRISPNPLPRTATGKIDRLQLPALFAELDQSGTSTT